MSHGKKVSWPSLLWDNLGQKHLAKGSVGSEYCPEQKWASAGKEGSGCQADNMLPDPLSVAQCPLSHSRKSVFRAAMRLKRSSTCPRLCQEDSEEQGFFVKSLGLATPIKVIFFSRTSNIFSILNPWMQFSVSGRGSNSDFWESFALRVVKSLFSSNWVLDDVQVLASWAITQNLVYIIKNNQDSFSPLPVFLLFEMRSHCCPGWPWIPGLKQYCLSA